MPWTPSTSFKHPLVNIKETNAEKSMTNWLSYDMANLLQWQGLGDIINAFRSVTLGLEPLTQRSGPYIVDRLRIPYTYCWSDGLIQKPPDWGRNVGTFHLDTKVLCPLTPRNLWLLLLGD
jgi:sterol 3beta-glucosyltransferase